MMNYWEYYGLVLPLCSWFWLTGRENMKQCKKCEIPKEEEDFYNTHDGKYKASYCKGCSDKLAAAHNKLYGTKNKAKDYRNKTTPSTYLKSLDVSEITKKEFNNVRYRFQMQASSLKKVLVDLNITLVK